jgi:CO/xanthine dehydrogenase Mo-binding subunit
MARFAVLPIVTNPVPDSPKLPVTVTVSVVAVDSAVANAVSDALSPLGIEINELPVTPERLFRLIEAAQARDKT